MLARVGEFITAILLGIGGDRVFQSIGKVGRHGEKGEGMSNKFEIRCNECLRTPDELVEYVDLAHEYNHQKSPGGKDFTPEDMVVMEEGTYNASNGHFVCTDCYIRIGMPSSRSGWVAP